MSAAVTIAEAARTLSVTRQTVRDWLRQGAPCAAPGTVGRGHGARVDVADLAAWRARRAGLVDTDSRTLEHVAAALWDVLRRNAAGSGAPLHRSLDITERAAAAVLLSAFERIHVRLTGAEAVRLPPEMQSLFCICVQSPKRQQSGDLST